MDHEYNSSSCDTEGDAHSCTTASEDHDTSLDKRIRQYYADREHDRNSKSTGSKRSKSVQNQASSSRKNSDRNKMRPIPKNPRQSRPEKPHKNRSDKPRTIYVRAPVQEPVHIRGDTPVSSSAESSAPPSPKRKRPKTTRKSPRRNPKLPEGYESSDPEPEPARGRERNQQRQKRRRSPDSVEHLRPPVIRRKPTKTKKDIYLGNSTDAEPECKGP